jgi:hypothetical protein
VATSVHALPAIQALASGLSAFIGVGLTVTDREPGRPASSFQLSMGIMYNLQYI